MILSNPALDLLTRSIGAEVVADVATVFFLHKVEVEAEVGVTMSSPTHAPTTTIVQRSWPVMMAKLSRTLRVLVVCFLVTTETNVHMQLVQQSQQCMSVIFLRNALFFIS